MSTGRLIVKLHDTIEIPYVDQAEQHLPPLLSGLWEAVLLQFPFLHLNRLLTEEGIEAVLNLMQDAQLAGNAPPLRLLNYFRIDLPFAVDLGLIGAALDTLSSVIEFWYEDSGTIELGVQAIDDPKMLLQGYLAPAPFGVDAMYAWNVAGGDGSGIRCLDVEQHGWNLSHEDLQGASIALLGANNNTNAEHGTNVLGVMVSVDNSVGGVGIVPRAQMLLKSVSLPNGSTDYDGIAVSLKTMQAGDIVLFEIGDGKMTCPAGGGPFEIKPFIAELIRGATGKGITVIEGAGNGCLDLDAYTDAQGIARFRRHVYDSGAILVGAASTPLESLTPRQRSSFSCFGDRVDCFAWGESVHTTSVTLPSGYKPNFRGTSSASAIVAGAAVALQGMAKAMLGRTLTPVEMRSYLSDPVINTPSADPLNDKIGVMPDLLAIREALCNEFSRPLVAGQWSTLRSGHELVYMGGDRVLDWEPANRQFRVWRYDRRVVAGDPLPGPPLNQGIWQTIGSGHKLIAVGGDQVLDWQPLTGEYRVFRADWLLPDFLPGPARVRGQWATIRNDPAAGLAHELVYLGADRVLDWEPPTGAYRLWRFDRFNNAGDPLPGNPVHSGFLIGVNPGDRLLVIDSNLVITWQPVTGVYRLLFFDLNQPGLFLPQPAQQGQWNSIRSGHQLIALANMNLLDWESATGAYRIFHSAPQSA